LQRERCTLALLLCDTVLLWCARCPRRHRVHRRYLYGCTTGSLLRKAHRLTSGCQARSSLCLARASGRCKLSPWGAQQPWCALSSNRGAHNAHCPEQLSSVRCLQTVVATAGSRKQGAAGPSTSRETTLPPVPHPLDLSS
jgi:hypothetical protein